MSIIEHDTYNIQQIMPINDRVSSDQLIHELDLYERGPGPDVIFFMTFLGLYKN